MKEKMKNEKGKWDLEAIVWECVREMKKAGIPIGKVIEANVVKDRHVFGRVHGLAARNGIMFILDISNAYRSPQFDLVEVKTVICHLLLHTVPDCMNHGEKWREYAEMADRECGLRIIRHAAERPEAGANWNGAALKARPLYHGKCCFLDFVAKLKELTEECAAELDEIGLRTGRVSGIVFLRDDKAYGRCRKNNNGDFTIFVSYKYAKREADRFGLKGLLCHELLHTCPEDDTNLRTGEHGPKWREMARKVEMELGYKVMSQSRTDAVRRASGTPARKYVCPVCGGYYNAFDKNDKAGMKAPRCKWCFNRMSAIPAEDAGVLEPLYRLLGECADKLKIAGIPVRRVSGIGFVPEGSRTGMHDNWDGGFSIDLPVAYGRPEMPGSDEVKSFLCRELIRTCGEDKWEEYVQMAETALGLSLR